MQLAGYEIPEQELQFAAIRAGGPGGQNVNKVSSAIHLRFDIRGSSLPESVKEGLLGYRDQRISGDGVIVIKAQRFRTQEKNRQDAVLRLEELIGRATHKPKDRTPTKATRASRLRRMDEKKARGRIKNLRGKPEPREG